MVDLSHAKRYMPTNGATDFALLTPMEVTRELADAHEKLPHNDGFALVVYNTDRGEMQQVRIYDDFAAADTAFAQQASEVSRLTVG